MLCRKLFFNDMSAKHVKCNDTLSNAMYSRRRAMLMHYILLFEIFFSKNHLLCIGIIF